MSARVVSLTKMEWDDVGVQPEPEVPVNCVKPQGLDNSPTNESWIKVRFSVGECGRI